VFAGARVPLIPGLLGYYFGTDYLARLIAVTHGMAVLFAAGSLSSPVSSLIVPAATLFPFL